MKLDEAYNKYPTMVEHPKRSSITFLMVFVRSLIIPHKGCEKMAIKPPVPIMRPIFVAGSPCASK
jgi:hypothetical protein